MGEREEKQKTLNGLKSAGGFIQRTLRKNLDLRTIPNIRFMLDDSLDRAEQISDLLEEAKKNLWWVANLFDYLSQTRCLTLVSTGVINIDKPEGLTSMDVVRRIRKVSNVRRVGHGGT